MIGSLSRGVNETHRSRSPASIRAVSAHYPRTGHHAASACAVVTAAKYDPMMIATDIIIVVVDDDKAVQGDLHEHL